MSRITRKQQKIFASAASNNGVFGSLQGADPTLSSDPDAIQGRTAYANGWNDATFSSELLPPLEEFQALQYLFSRQIAYIMQEGIPEWDTSTTYYKGNMVKVVSGDEYTLFESIADNNTGNLTSDTTKWKVCGVSQDFNTGLHAWRSDVTYGIGDWVKGVGDDGNPDIFQSLQDNNKGNAVTDGDYWSAMCLGKNGFPLLSCMWAGHRLNEASWLRADTWSWQDGGIYHAAYNMIKDQFDNGTQTSEIVSGIEIPFVLGANGMKIVDADNAGLVQDIFESVGVAWYYIIDTTNKKFKLPRTSVQENATEMHLYFYVGNTVRNQTEIDVGELTEQLNEKWDSSRMVVTTALPVNPQTGVFYFIK